MMADPIPEGWCAKPGPSPVRCAICHDNEPHPCRQSLLFLGKERYVYCTFNHVKESMLMMRTGTWLLVEPPMTDEEYEEWRRVESA